MYSLGNSAPVVNPGYYDVPIQNQYSNPVRQGNEIKLGNYALNTTIGNTINSNDDNYIVYSPPTKASPSLYIEQDAPMSGYEYGNDVSKYIPAMNETNKFNQRQVPTGYIPPQVIEKFSGGGGGGGGSRSGGGLNMARTGGAGGLRSNTMNMPISGHGYGVQVDGGRRDGQASVGFQQLARNQEIAQHPNRHNRPEQRRRRQVYNNYIPLERPAWGYYNDYLNVNSIPNIAGYYDNVVDYVVEDDYDNIDNRDYNDYQYEQQDNKKNKKLEELDNIKATDIDDLKLMAENIKKDKLKKKKKNKNKPSAIYLVILLLIVLILLMLYMILKNPKKVRF